MKNAMSHLLIGIWEASKIVPKVTVNGLRQAPHLQTPLRTLVLLPSLDCTCKWPFPCDSYNAGRRGHPAREWIQANHGPCPHRSIVAPASPDSTHRHSIFHSSCNKCYTFIHSCQLFLLHFYC